MFEIGKVDDDGKPADELKTARAVAEDSPGNTHNFFSFCKYIYT